VRLYALLALGQLERLEAAVDELEGRDLVRVLDVLAYKKDPGRSTRNLPPSWEQNDTRYALRVSDLNRKDGAAEVKENHV